MLQLRSGDLISVRRDDTLVRFAVLTKQLLFGGHWSFVFHGSSTPALSPSGPARRSPGFNAAVDFIVPNREGRVVRVSRDNDFDALMGPELLQQPPAKGQVNYQIWRWENGQRRHASRVRFTPSPTPDELAAPFYSCMPADWACDLAVQSWTPSLGRAL